MAEFSEVMSQFARLCDYYSQRSCQGCPVDEEGFNCACEKQGCSKSSAEELETIIMKWAEEHAKPQYPTVYEWLVSVGLLSGDMWSVSDLHKPISPEFAQMLGIQPVPVVHGDCGATSEKEARKKLGLQPKEG